MPKGFSQPIDRLQSTKKSIFWLFEHSFYIWICWGVELYVSNQKKMSLEKSLFDISHRKLNLKVTLNAKINRIDDREIFGASLTTLPLYGYLCSCMISRVLSLPEPSGVAFYRVLGPLIKNSCSIRNILSIDSDVRFLFS